MPFPCSRLASISPAAGFTKEYRAWLWSDECDTYALMNRVQPNSSDADRTKQFCVQEKVPATKSGESASTTFPCCLFLVPGTLSAPASCPRERASRPGRRSPTAAMSSREREVRRPGSIAWKSARRPPTSSTTACRPHGSEKGGGHSPVRQDMCCSPWRDVLNVCVRKVTVAFF
jgi:hypothetical protein